MMAKSFEEIMALIPPSAFTDRGKFAPKLNFQQRCEVLALYKQGVSRACLADVFNIDRRTVTHMHNPQSKHYRDVRAEYERLGHDEFCRTYITENGTARINAVLNKAESALGQRANRNAGINMVGNDFTHHDHRVQIEWRDGAIGVGWYYQDVDGPAPSEWLHNGPDSIRTSTDCLKAVKENLFDA
jgi:hypothetical protein